ncbi:MAG TPA: DUF3616 domain-containing protein [Chthoniobacterales bacterium]
MSTPVILQFDETSEFAASAVSSVTRVGQDLWIGADEGTAIVHMASDGENRFIAQDVVDLVERLDLPAQSAEGEDLLPEIDIEGMDWEASRGYLWLIGSHSLKRKKPNPADPARNPIEQLGKVSADGNRFVLGRIPLKVGANGESALVERMSDERFAARLDSNRFGSELLEELRKDKLFQRFVPKKGKDSENGNIPGKDNGLDLEGLAVAGENRLFVGLRGPVLRGWACALELQIEEDAREPGKPALLRLRDFGEGNRRYRRIFLQLDGLGVRDLCFDGDDLLILAGPSMDLDWPVAIYRWKGARDKTTRDAIIELDGKTLSRVPVAVRPPGELGMDRAEGLSLWSPGSGFPRVLIAFDKPSPLRQAGRRTTVCEALQVLSPPKSGSAALLEPLWRVFIESSAPLDIQQDCAVSLGAMVRSGVHQMEADARINPQDLENAKDHLRWFLLEMKRTAAEMQVNSLAQDVLEKTMNRLIPKGLWPFIPPRCELEDISH